MTARQQFKTKAITGVIALLYCLTPIIQDNVFDDFSNRFNNYYIFFLSSGVYGFMQLFYTNTIATYVIQLILWLLIWWVLYFTVKFFCM
jgi:hypothetical protein